MTCFYLRDSFFLSFLFADDLRCYSTISGNCQTTSRDFLSLGISFYRSQARRPVKIVVEIIVSSRKGSISSNLSCAKCDCNLQPIKFKSASRPVEFYLLRSALFSYTLLIYWCIHLTDLESSIFGRMSSIQNHKTGFRTFYVPVSLSIPIIYAWEAINFIHLWAHIFGFLFFRRISESRPRQQG